MTWFSDGMNEERSKDIMNNNGFRLGSIAGVEIVIDWSLLIVFFLVSFSLGAGILPSWHPTWPPALVWGVALIAAVLFFASVLVHELSHALVGRARGVEIRRITLFVFGGMAHLEHEPKSWSAELWMAAVGPVTSLLLGVIFSFVGGLLSGVATIDPDQPERMLSTLSPVATIFLWLGSVNIMLGMFNLIPGFPLDGGRILRAILWGITKNLRHATRWASRAGQGVGLLLIGAGIVMMFGRRVPYLGSGFVSGVWIALIGWFLNNAAVRSYLALLTRESLDDVPVARIMRSAFAHVDPELSVNTLVDEYFMARDQHAFPVVEGRRLVGLVCLEDVRKVERDQWGNVRVKDIMTPFSELTRVTPTEPTSEAMVALARLGVDQLPVVENGEVRGMVRREDILKWLSLYGRRELMG